MKLMKTANAICGWLVQNIIESGHKGGVVGVSGGVDSALTSALLAKTGLHCHLLTMPIHQNVDHTSRGIRHCSQLAKEHDKVSWGKNDLSDVFDTFKASMEMHLLGEPSELAWANMRSRIRMTALYSLANHYKCMVIGTGNLVEDFGIGFFTKYGDGGVDLSPIGRLTKTQVQKLAMFMGVSDEIVSAPPTDGLWNDGRSDEDQIGCTYQDLEDAMDFCERFEIHEFNDYITKAKEHNSFPNLNALDIYLSRHNANAHKMAMPPIGPEAIL